MQPAFLRAAILEVAFVVFLVFGIHIVTVEEVVVSLQIVNSVIDETQVVQFLHFALPSLTAIVLFTLMFLFLVGGSGIFPELLSDPLLSVMLIKPLSRQQMLLSRFLGLVLAVCLHTLLLGVSVSVVLTSKLNWLVFTPLLGSLSFVMEFFVMSCWCALFGMVLRQSASVSIIALILYFVLGPLLARGLELGNTLASVFSAVLPRMGELHSISKNLVLLKPVVFNPFLASLIPALFVLSVAAWIFARSDL
jgi:ABC-type transport system involved in multi-copper enzyme maturation permease subunit